MGWVFLINGIFTIAGLLNGLLWALLHGGRRIGRSLFLGWLCAVLPAWYYLWYAKGHSLLPDWTIWPAYILCGLMVANLIFLLPALCLSVLSIPKKLRPVTEKLSGAVLVLAALIGIYGAVDGNLREQTEYIDIWSDRIPAGFEGYRIAQMTDAHIGPYFRYTDLPGEIERARRAGAKTLFFTGDLIDDIKFMPETAEILTRSVPLFPDGIIYSWGNHEFYRGKEYIRSELEKTPVILLENQHTVLHRGGDTLYVAGVDFPFSRGEAEVRERKEWMDQAYEGVPDGAPSLLLSHCTDFIDDGFARGVILTMTGHTHGTQIGLLGKPILTPFPYTRGMYSDGTHYGYVSRGSAGWFPFRFGCPRELVIFTLHSGKKPESV